MKGILVCLGIALLLFGCIDQSDKSRNDTNLTNFSEDRNIQVECQIDSDCVPDGCCHPSSCIPSDQATQCNGTFCTQECQEGTLDCGGSCGCVDGKCTGSGPFFNEVNE